MWGDAGGLLKTPYGENFFISNWTFYTIMDRGGGSRG